MKWPNHFGKARNKAVELAKCDDADWVVMFDADEVLTRGSDLRQNLKLMPEDKDLVAIYHKTGVGHRFHRNCIWRPGKATWKYAIHEHLLSTHDNNSVTLNFEVLHPDEIGTEHNKAGVMELLANDAEEFPDNATRQYYYGRQLYYERRADSIPILRHCAEISKWDAESANCLVMIGNLFAGKAQTAKDDTDDTEYKRCSELALDFYRQSVVKYPKLRGSYAGIIRGETNQEEIIRAGMACLAIKESTFFDDSPRFYTDDFEYWVKGKIEKNAIERIEINEDITIDVH
jgi:glycosyltransferase involved in cell wall biosynthesis